MKVIYGILLVAVLFSSCGCASFERSRPWEGTLTSPDKKKHFICSYAGTMGLGFILSHQAWQDSGVRDIKYFGTFDNMLKAADKPKRSTAVAYRIGAFFTFVFGGLGKEFLADDKVSVYDIVVDAAGCGLAYATGSVLKIRW